MAAESVSMSKANLVHMSRLLLVLPAITLVLWWGYWAALDHSHALVAWLLDVEEGGRPTGAVAIGIAFIGFVLIWWRVVKVTLVLGSPFPLGLKSATLRENGTENGRSVTVAFIESTDPKDVVFGVVARSHPRSDKIVRSRIDVLLVTMFAHTFVMRGSRFSKLDADVFRRSWFIESWRHHHRFWRKEVSGWDKETLSDLVSTKEPT